VVFDWCCAWTNYLLFWERDEMIELRWVKRKKSYVDEDGEFPYTENVLQYRYFHQDYAPWSEWTDVPVVEEEK
jgi:hypothetical protein